MTKIPIALNIIAPSDLLGVYKGRMINIIRLDSNKWLPAVCCTGVRYGPKDVPFFIFESCNVKTLLNANDYGKYWLPVGTPPVKFYGQITKCDMNKFMDEVQELYKTGVFNKVTEDVSELYKTGNFNVTTKTEYGTRRDIKIDDKATLPSSNTLIFYDEQIAKDVLISLIHEGYRVSTKLVKDEKGTLCVEMIYFAKPIDE